MKEQLEAKKKKCNLRQAKCCANCCHFDYEENDFGATYSQFCSCPENEDKSAKPGEDAFFEVNDTDVCDNWHGKDANGNPLKDIIRIDAEPRYPEDAYINGEGEDNDNPKMPFLVKQEGTQCGWCWKLDIDIKTGEIIGWPKDVKAKVHYKVCDCCGIKYEGLEYSDYVPDFLAIDDQGYGDYIILSIEDGKIVDWDEESCREFIEDLRKDDA